MKEKFTNLLISELHGTLSRHVFEETAERSLIFKPQNIGSGRNAAHPS